MHLTTVQVIGTVLATGVVGFVVWLVTVPLRLRSVTGLVASVVVTGPLAVLGGIGWALILGPNVSGPREALLLAGIAVLVAAAESGVAAARAYRRFARANRELRATLEEIAGGALPEAGSSPRLLTELETVRTELAGAARTLAAARQRDHAQDESRRQLIAWVSQDLHAPLTVLRAMSDLVAAPGAAGNDVREEVARLVSVVDDLFDLATANPDHATRSLVLARWEPAHLADVLGDAVTALEPLARLRGVGMRVRGATALQVRLLGPAGDDLGRRLVALMVDAVRHSEPGSTMRLDVAPDPSDPTAVRIDLHPGTTEREVAQEPAVPASTLQLWSHLAPARRLAVCLPVHAPAA